MINYFLIIYLIITSFLLTKGSVYAKESEVKLANRKKNLEQLAFPEVDRTFCNKELTDVTWNFLYERRKNQQLDQEDTKARQLRRRYKPGVSVVYSVGKIADIPIGEYEDNGCWIYATFKVIRPATDKERVITATNENQWEIPEFSMPDVSPNYYCFGWSLENSKIYATNNNSIVTLQVGDCIVISKERPARLMNIKKIGPTRSYLECLVVRIHLMESPTIRKYTVQTYSN